jgi:membrane protein YdbS with pleckstrin-like domain
MADAAKYLLPTERVAIKIRRHWAVLAADTLSSILLLAIGVLLARITSSVQYAETVLIYFCIFVVLRWLWKIWEWYHETLIVTDKRLLLLTGVFYRNVAIMPLVKVTDLTYHRSANGLTFGYGKFVVESAGQDQALSTIDFVPKPDLLYRQISDLLFGGDKGSPGALVTEAQRHAEEEAERRARARPRFGRRFTRRRTEPVEERSSGSAPSQLDAILADRDTLLADRDDADSDWDGPRSGSPYDRPAYGQPSYGQSAYGPRPYDRPSYDRPSYDSPSYDSPSYDSPSYDSPSADRPSYDRPAADRPSYGERGEDRYRRPADPTARLPRIHEPRRGDSTGRSDVVRPERPLPPPRPDDAPPPPPGVDPADD